MQAFEVTPSSLSLIFYAPNHVRIWSRDTYDKAGGHDEGMTVGDDHELLCRTYLTGARMVRIPEVLYLYRLQRRTGKYLPEAEQGNPTDTTTDVQSLRLPIDR